MEDSDDETLGQSNVFLGYAGRSLSKKDLSPFGNHIGGVPAWFANSPPSKDILYCKSCNEPKSLLTQISAPLDGKYYDRSLFVFICPRAACRRNPDSVCVIRGVHKTAEVEQRIKKEEEEAAGPDEPTPTRGDLGDLLFGSKGAESVNPFSNPSSGQLLASSQTKTDPQAVSNKEISCSRNTPPDNTTVSSEDVNAEGYFPCREIDVEEETLSPEAPLSNITVEQLEEHLHEDGDAEPEQTKGSDNDITELASSAADTVFSNFITLIEHNPEQILRYERPLRPVPYCHDDIYPILLDPSKIPKTANGTSREFELQLMPHLISELETDDMLLDGMEWGTIVIATSKDDTLPELNKLGVGYTEEWVGVQWEAVE